MAGFIFTSVLCIILIIAFIGSSLTKARKLKGEITPEQAKKKQITYLIIMIIIFVLFNIRLLLR